MKHTYATKEQIQIIKKLQYDVGNIRAAGRPYVRMRYVSAIKEIDMLRKKLSKIKPSIKTTDPLSSYSAEQLRELSLLGIEYLTTTE